MEKKIHSALELSGMLEEVRSKAVQSIVELMKANKLKSVNFDLDCEGRDNTDEDFDEDFYYDYRVMVECEDKYDTCAYNPIYEVELKDDDTLNVKVKDEYDGSIIAPCYLYVSIHNYIGILAHIQAKVDYKNENK